MLESCDDRPQVPLAALAAAAVMHISASRVSHAFAVMAAAIFPSGAAGAAGGAGGSGALSAPSVPPLEPEVVDELVEALYDRCVLLHCVQSAYMCLPALRLPVLRQWKLAGLRPVGPAASLPVSYTTTSVERA